MDSNRLTRKREEVKISRQGWGGAVRESRYIFDRGRALIEMKHISLPLSGSVGQTILSELHLYTQIWNCTEDATRFYVP